MLQSMFFYFQLFMSSSSEVIYHGGRLPDFQNFENCVGLYWTSLTNVKKHVLWIYSYWGHLSVMSSSIEVVFQIFKFFKIVLGSIGLVLQMLQSMFCWFPAIKSSSSEVVFQWGRIPWRSSSRFSKILKLFWALLN